ncbi:MAG: hypothetical protein KatS3mg076_2093 [Candidatus Binatia bacterium]|nr:MAG: hypothetical protein KatS3mg076_2093 [Candidatus Binatia bacterium]
MRKSPVGPVSHEKNPAKSVGPDRPGGIFSRPPRSVVAVFADGGNVDPSMRTVVSPPPGRDGARPSVVHVRAWYLGPPRPTNSEGHALSWPRSPTAGTSIPGCERSSFFRPPRTRRSASLRGPRSCVVPPSAPRGRIRRATLCHGRVRRRRERRSLDANTVVSSPPGRDGARPSVVHVRAWYLGPPPPTNSEGHALSWPRSPTAGTSIPRCEHGRFLAPRTRRSASLRMAVFPDGVDAGARTRTPARISRPPRTRRSASLRMAVFADAVDAGARTRTPARISRPPDATERVRGVTCP